MPKKGYFPSHILTDEGWSKRCRTCGQVKLLTEFWPLYGKKSGYRHECKQCIAKRRHGDLTGWVPLHEVQWILLELVTRIGRAETARRLGVHRSHITKWMKQPGTTGWLKDRGKKKGQGVRQVQRRTAARWLLLLRDVRSVEYCIVATREVVKGEIRHELDIRRGSRQRGEVERGVRYERKGEDGWRMAS